MHKINKIIIHNLNFSGGWVVGSGSELKGKSYLLLLEYLKDSSQSDRQIAKKLGLSQATVSRLRNKLVKDGVILQFSAIPDLAKMGYEIMAFSFVKFKLGQVNSIQAMAQEWAENHPEILFTSRAEGMGADAVTISVHKTYADYKNFLAENRDLWGHLMDDVHFVLVDLCGGFTKPMSFSSLAKESET